MAQETNGTQSQASEGASETPTTGTETESTSVATSAPEGDGQTPPTAVAPTTEPKPLSAFKLRQLEKGRDSFICEGPQELVDMMRAAAKAKDDMSLSSWVRFAVAEQVNLAKLTHEVTKPGDDKVTIEPWVFDLDELSESKAKKSTRGLTEEQKKEKKDEKAKEERAEREQIKLILQRHKEALKGGDPRAKAIQEEADTAAKEALEKAAATATTSGK